MNIRIAPIIPALLVAAIGFSAPTLTSSSRRMYTPDPHSMDIVDDDDGIPRMEVRGFTTPIAARTGYNFADILTNKNVSVSNLKVLLRDGTGDDRQLKYADIAKIVGYSGGGDGGHGVDNQSVTTNSDNNATLYGFEDAFYETFPVKTSNDYLEWFYFDDDSFDVSMSGNRYNRYVSINGINDSENNGKVLYADNGVARWGTIDADESSIHVEDRTFSLVGWDDASAGHIPFKGDADLDWGGIVGDEKTVEFEGMSDGEDAKIYLHGADESSSHDKYAYLDSSGELQWIDPVENKSTQTYKYNGYNRVQLYGWTDGQKAIPYNGGSNLAWLQFDGSSSENKYLASNGDSIFWVNNPQKGDKGDNGDPGQDGRDGTDGNPGEWITNHVAEIVQLLSGNFVTSVNGETGDVVLKTLTLFTESGSSVTEHTYDGSEDVEVDCTIASYASYANIATYANSAGEIGPPPNSLQRSAPLAKSAAPSTNAVRSAGSASPSGLSFSANGSVLTITDGTHTWKLDAQ